MAEISRLFVGLPLPADLVERIGGLQDALRKRIDPDAVRWVRPAQVHLTLCFLGEVANDRIPSLDTALGGVCAGQARRRLRVGGVGAFPSLRQPRVIWLGLAGDLPGLESLQTAVAGVCEAYAPSSTEKRFSPHLTLGRVKDRPGRWVRMAADALAEFRFEESWAWAVEEVRLIRSRLRPGGSVYTTLGEHALKAVADDQRT